MPLPVTRRIRSLVAALAVAALLWLLFAAAERFLALAQRFLALPAALQWLLGGALALLAVAGAMVLWWVFRPRRTRPLPPAPSRQTLQARIDGLQRQGAATQALGSELQDLDRRRASGRVYVAVFGEISTGKTSLVRALAPGALLPTDARGGTTREVVHRDGRLPDGREVCLADVPGSAEVAGEARETLARDEALRAHAVVYVCNGDLTRSQMRELQWLRQFGKPLVVVLNKVDQWRADERETLLGTLRERTRGIATAVVATSAGGSERLQRQLADGRVEQVQRERTPHIDDLQRVLSRLVGGGAAALEPARERAVLARLQQRVGSAETAARREQALHIVRRYARRAVVGALAAVAPGSDLIIQGALATGMTRDLAALYGVGVSDVDIEAFLRQVRVTVRTSTALLLAIAGNALKAFPGLGTLGGGVVHAFAYALIFDSLGRALALTLEQRQRLDQDAAVAHLEDLMATPGAERLRQLAGLTREALRGEDGDGAA